MSETKQNQFNQLPAGYEGEQKRRTDFASEDEKVAYDAANLLAKTNGGKDMATALLLVERQDDNRKALEGAMRRMIKDPKIDNCETKLSPEQVTWVREGIERDYDRTKLVNVPVLEGKGVPRFPSKEAALKSALKELKPEQVDYMMESPNPFSFQIKLVTPSNRLDLQRKLINDQPKRMGMPNQEQQDLYINPSVEQHITSQNNTQQIEWKWEFGQGEQIMQLEAWDDVKLTREVRRQRFKAQLPQGMKGTDLFTWATRMADALEKGKPLDIKFANDATNSSEYEEFLYTILDELGVLTEDQIRFLVDGYFYPYGRKAYLRRYLA